MYEYTTLLLCEWSVPQVSIYFHYEDARLPVGLESIVGLSYVYRGVLTVLLQVFTDTQKYTYYNY